MKKLNLIVALCFMMCLFSCKKEPRMADPDSAYLCFQAAEQVIHVTGETTVAKIKL